MVICSLLELACSITMGTYSGCVCRDSSLCATSAQACLLHAGVIVVAATNFPESLDKALVRPGRFDWHVTVPNPDVRGRVQILEVHFRDVPRQDDVDLEVCRCPSKLVFRCSMPDDRQALP